jgi:uncharacterized protein
MSSDSLEGIEMEAKLVALESRLRSLGSAVIAYSGGVDSTFLAQVAHDVLGRQALAVTACSETYPSWEREEAVATARRIGFRHRLVQTSELEMPGFADNPADRCYFCKTELFQTLRKIADEEGLLHVLVGTTAEHLDDFRPGCRSATELGVISPLLEAGLKKTEIRVLSKMRGLPTWDKPASACLASRIPYNSVITLEKLRQIELAEGYLRSVGIGQCRVRHHGEMARIEVAPGDISLISADLREGIVIHLRKLGFTYVTVDLAGYRPGSMNEVLGLIASDNAL